MNYIKTASFLAATIILVSGIVSAQSAGDFRSHTSGDWGNTATWERYNGSSWVTPAPTIPDTLGLTTIRTGDSVVVTDSVKTYVGNSTIQAGAVVTVVGKTDSTVTLNVANGTMTVNGTLMQTGGPAPSPGPYAVTLENSGSLVVGNGGTFRQDQNGGQIPQATWNPGSTFLITGITTSTSTGGNGVQDYYNIVWNCPNQTANCNMGFHPSQGTTLFDTTVTVHGNITILKTGVASRAYLCGIRPGTSDTTRNKTHITINGNITVLNGAIFSSNGTSSAYTNIYVTVLGNISVRDSGSQLAISRGSQSGLGNVTWYIKSDSVYYGPKTTNQNSTDAATAITSKGKFIFCKAGTQVVTLDTLVNWTGPCNMQFGDSVTATTVLIGNSPFIGSGTVQRIKHNATVIAGPEGYIGGGNNSTPLPSNFAIDSGATLVTASPNGIKATGTGSSGAVRVTGNRDYGTAANYEYNGTSHQRLGSGFPASAHNLKINNSAGVYIDSVAAFTITDSLTVTSGHLDLNGATVTLGPAGMLSETSGNTVNGTSGVITTTRTLTAPSSSVNIAGLGVSIGSAADLGSTVLTRGHAVQGGAGIARYFDVTPTTDTGLDATLVFRYDVSELNGQDPATMRLSRSTNAGTTWATYAATNNAAQHTLTAAGIGSLSRWTAGDTTHPLGATFQLSLAAGWNMVSLPVRVQDGRKSVLFPAAISRAFSYEGSYVANDSMQFGVGYWLKVGDAQTIGISGLLVSADTFKAAKGWNIICAISAPVPINSITSLPGPLTTSPFFGYNGSYFIEDTLKPGSSYWIKAADTGRFVLSGSPVNISVANRLNIVPESATPPPPPEAGQARTGTPLPDAFSLSKNYPNPFNPSTRFVVAVPLNAQVDVGVYNLLGQRIRTLASGEMGAGYHTIEWNGLTDGGAQAGSGIYFLRMASASFRAVNKIILMK
jgi:flagellar hook capping protein FlgD